MSDPTTPPVEHGGPPLDMPPPPAADVEVPAVGTSTEGKGRRKKEKGPKQPRSKGSGRGRRGERRAVPTEGFDFRGGAFSAAVRTRVLNLVLIALVVLVAGTLLARAVTGGVAASNDRAAAAEATEEADTLAIELAERSATGASPQSEVDAHIDSRARQIASATENEIDWPKIFSAVNNIGSGISITSVTVGEPEEEEAGTQPAEGDTSATSGESDITITVKGALSSSAALPALEAALTDPQRFGWADGGAVESSCGAGSTVESGNRDDEEAVPAGAACTWTWTSTLSDKAFSARSTEIPAAITRPGAAEEGN
jgi:hypothetical protein